MLKKFLCLMALAASLLACKSNHKAYIKFLNKDSLPSQFIEIDNGSDTTVRTANGAILKISKGSFSSNKVKLQVKEAYSIEQMVLAGLTTESDGKPLSSGGMIYISSVDKNVNITKPISVSIPTNFYDSKMNVYRGEEENEKINWIDPQPLATKDSLPTYLQQGKLIFEHSCANCHGLDKVVTGPALVGVELRGPWKERKNLFAFTKDPATFMATSKYVQSEKCKYGVMMTAFPAINDDALNALYDYLKNETLQRGITKVNDNIMDCLDSCQAYDSLYRLINKIKRTKGDLIEDNGNRINYTRLAVPSTRDRAGSILKVSAGDDEGNEHKAIYYRFDIASFGWYNIDRLLDYASPTESTLRVQINTSLTDEFDVFIAVPQFKTFDRGGKLSDSSYGFFTLDGKIPLPVNSKVVVFAVGEADEKIVFDYKEFYSDKSNDIQLNPKLVSKESFNSIVKTFALDSIAIEAKDSKNAEKIRQANNDIQSNQQLLELFRPKNCDCNCGAKDSIR